MAQIQFGAPSGGGGQMSPQRKQQQVPQTDRYSQFASQQPEYEGRPTTPQPQQSGGGQMGGGMQRQPQSRPWGGQPPQTGGMGMGQPPAPSTFGGSAPQPMQRPMPQSRWNARLGNYGNGGGGIKIQMPRGSGGMAGGPAPSSPDAPPATGLSSIGGLSGTAHQVTDPGAPPPTQLGGANRAEDSLMVSPDPQNGAVSGADPYAQIPVGLRPQPIGVPGQTLDDASGIQGGPMNYQQQLAQRFNGYRQM